MAGIQKTKHTSGGPQAAPVTVSGGLPQSLAGHYFDQTPPTQLQSAAGAVHLVRAMDDLDKVV